MKFLIINGPNLNLLGTREPDVYGTERLDQLERLWTHLGERIGVTIETFQSNHEGAIIDAIHEASGTVDALILNAGAYSHTSYAIHDAIVGTGIRTVEVHISNIHEREEWRDHSVISAAADHVIVGRGTPGYIHAIVFLHAQLSAPPSRYRYAEHPDGFLDLRMPSGDGPHPVVVLVHGGYWEEIWLRDTIDPLAAALVAHGYATINPEYHRGAGSFPASNNDIDAVIDWAHEQGADLGLDPGRLLLIGHSAGGYHVLHAAQRRNDFSGSVALAPVTDLYDIAARCSEESEVDPATNFLGVTEKENPGAWVEASLTETPLVPVHLIHGTDDDIVNIAQARSYIMAIEGDHMLTELDGVDHFGIVDPGSPAFETILDAINEMQRDPGSD